jgi:hypothetical protein
MQKHPDSTLQVSVHVDVEGLQQPAQLCGDDQGQEAQALQVLHGLQVKMAGVAIHNKQDPDAGIE